MNRKKRMRQLRAIVDQASRLWTEQPGPLCEIHMPNLMTVCGKSGIYAACPDVGAIVGRELGDLEGRKMIGLIFQASGLAEAMGILAFTRLIHSAKPEDVRPATRDFAPYFDQPVAVGSPHGSRGKEPFHVGHMITIAWNQKREAWGGSVLVLNPHSLEMARHYHDLSEVRPFITPNFEEPNGF